MQLLVCNRDWQAYIFLEHAGELRIFVLRREKWPITITNHTPWARVGDGRKTQKKRDLHKQIGRRT